MQVDSHLLALLTARERQIISLVAKGMCNKEMSRQLQVEVSTIKMHLHNIFLKLRISNRVTLAIVALGIDDRFWS